MCRSSCCITSTQREDGLERAGKLLRVCGGVDNHFVVAVSTRAVLLRAHHIDERIWREAALPPLGMCAPVWLAGPATWKACTGLPRGWVAHHGHGATVGIPGAEYSRKCGAKNQPPCRWIEECGRMLVDEG